MLLTLPMSLAQSGFEKIIFSFGGDTNGPYSLAGPGKKQIK